MTSASRLPAPPPRPGFEFGSSFKPAVDKPKPPAMVWSVRLWLVAFAAATVTAALALLNFDQLHAGLLAKVVREFPDETPATSARATAAALLILIGSGLLIATLQAGFALAMGSRRRLARLALVPLWLLGAIHALAMFSTVRSPVLLGLPVAVGLSAIATAAMFLPTSSAWLAAPAGRRRAGRQS
jgi:hypothetical protein